MLTRRLLSLLVLSALAFGLLACGATPPQTESTSPTPAWTAFALPQTEADVPRVRVSAAKAAIDAGLAILVDVRSAQSYAAGHAMGALSLPLTQVEAEPGGVSLDRDQWIITYCT
jgi:3-mercaptopyruvate sulfurtransferase SseA